MNVNDFARKQELTRRYAQMVINKTKAKAKAQKESDIRTGKLKVSKAVKPKKTVARRTKKK